MRNLVQKVFEVFEKFFEDLRHELLETRSDSAIPAVANVEDVDAIIGVLEEIPRPIFDARYCEDFGVASLAVEIEESDSEGTP